MSEQQGSGGNSQHQQQRRPPPPYQPPPTPAGPPSGAPAASANPQNAPAGMPASSGTLPGPGRPASPGMPCKPRHACEARHADKSGQTGSTGASVCRVSPDPPVRLPTVRHPERLLRAPASRAPAPGYPSQAGTHARQPPRPPEQPGGQTQTETQTAQPQPGTTDPPRLGLCRARTNTRRNSGRAATITADPAKVAAARKPSARQPSGPPAPRPEPPPLPIRRRSCPEQKIPSRPRT